MSSSGRKSRPSAWVTPIRSSSSLQQKPERYASGFPAAVSMLTPPAEDHLNDAAIAENDCVSRASPKMARYLADDGFRADAARRGPRSRSARAEAPASSQRFNAENGRVRPDADQRDC